MAIKKLIFILSAVTCIYSQNTWEGNGFQAYLNSNDEIIIRLSSARPNQLRGAPGEIVNLEFIVYNKGSTSQFEIRQYSDDGFTGRLSSSRIFLSSDQQQTVEVTNLVVPDRAGSKVRLTLEVFKLNEFRNRRKRQGGSGTYGSDQNRGDQGLAGDFGYTAPLPGNKKQTSITVEFTVTEGFEEEDETEPTVEIHYVADSSEDVCQHSMGDSGCERSVWKFKAIIHDEESGLQLFDVEKKGTLGATFHGSREDAIYYRYVNYPIGTTNQAEVDVTVTCCLEKVEVRVTNVAGLETRLEAESTQYGSTSSEDGLSGELVLGLIIGGVILVVIIIAALIIFVWRKKYRPVPTNS